MTSKLDPAALPATPGPWRYAEIRRPPIGRGPHETDALGNIFWGYSITGSSEKGAAILPTLAAVHNFPENCEANARLIAAAPDLYEACAAALATHSLTESEAGLPSLIEVEKMLRAALARARGQQS